jgi:hypothetical protein
MESDRRHPSRSVMWPLFVVGNEPLMGHLSHLIQIIKQVGVQHFLPVIPVEVLDKCVLVGLPWLDIAQFDVMLSVPV